MYIHYITYGNAYIHTYIDIYPYMYCLYEQNMDIFSQNCCKWMGTPTWTSPVVPILLLLSQPRCSSMVALADPAPRSKVKNFDLHGSVPNLCEARCSSAVLLHWHSHFDDGIWLMLCCHILRNSCQGYHHHVACHNCANLHSRQMPMLTLTRRIVLRFIIWLIPARCFLCILTGYVWKRGMSPNGNFNRDNE